LSPDFYGWVFPHGDTMSVGTGSADKGFSLRGAVGRLRDAAGLQQATVLRREGAPLPMKPLPRWDNGRDVVLAGDAAGVVAPASGEGIYYAMLGGRLAAEAAHEMLTTGNTKALKLARKRLEKFPSIRLSQQNVVELSLTEKYDAAFSYGGVWYFVIDGEKEPFMVSHIPDEAGNLIGLKKLAAQIVPGGMLLLGIQGPHFDYEKPISNGMTYAQQIAPHDYGFTKHYYLLDEGQRVMSQTIDYRTYSWSQTLQMLGDLGFSFVPQSGGAGKFLAFRKAPYSRCPNLRSCSWVQATWAIPSQPICCVQVII
jgi:hypothetical protein